MNALNGLIKAMYIWFLFKEIILNVLLKIIFFHLSRKPGNNGEIDPIGMYDSSNGSLNALNKVFFVLLWYPILI